ncbi:hypothetical protein BGX21_004575 [Mortierella sp. AD011]|nr:hypothetical protein BGX20_009271 [Mortierella sp. AD010]KAF9373085.1 hypothetical protein BGX21_004575 [Mortierella sp. AD011]
MDANITMVNYATCRLHLHHPILPHIVLSCSSNASILPRVSTYVWFTLSFMWFTDLTWQDYDPHLYSQSSSLSSATPSLVQTATTTTATATATGIIPAVVGGYTLFPSQEPTIMTSFTTPTATTSIPTPTSTAVAEAAAVAEEAAAIHKVQWASQCHTSSGLDTTPCQLMLAYNILGCLIGAVMILEGIMSWCINMKEETVEQRLKRLQAKDDAKAVKVARREKKVIRDSDRSRPIIQGPLIG